MASKNKKPADQEDVKRDYGFQAILLAESFSKSFRPATLQSPKVLLPLVDGTILDYTIEFLAVNGVTEVFVFCVWHAAQLEKYIKTSKWSTVITIHCISSKSCMSAGDALRELDSMGVIRSDPFVIIYGDVISNFNLSAAVEFHRQRRKEDSNTIMTMVLKEIQTCSGIESVNDNLVLATDSSTGQILYFDNHSKNNNISLPTELALEHFSIDLSTNLLDCHIDICSPELMLQFSDNFDYQDIRNDFVKNEVVNWELGMHIYGYKVKDQYAARIHDPQTYHTICDDIVSNWIHPVVSISNQHKGSNIRNIISNHSSLNKSIKIAKSAYIGENVVIQNHCMIESDVRLHRSTLGQHCKVGSGSMIQDSHLWNDVIIEENVKIDSSIIGAGSIIKKNAIIPRGCIIAENVIIGSNVVLKEYTRVHALSKDEQTDVTVLGSESRGKIWTYELSGDYDEDEENDEDIDDGTGDITDHSSYELLKRQSIGCLEEKLMKWKKYDIPEEPEDDDDDDDDDDDEDDDEGGDYDQDMNISDNYYEDNDIGDEQQAMKSGTISTTTSNKVKSSNNKSITDDATSFYEVVADMIMSGYEEGHPCDSVLMEVKGYKFSRNKTFSDCIYGVVPAIVKILLKTNPTKIAFITLTKKFFSEDNWGYDVLTSLIQGNDDGLAVIKAFEKEAVKAEYQSTLYAWFRFLLQLLYEAEILEEEVLLKWIASRSSKDAADSHNHDEAIMKLYHEKDIQSFVEWIQEAEEEDDDSDDEEDEDEED